MVGNITGLALNTAQLAAGYAVSVLLSPARDIGNGLIVPDVFISEMENAAARYTEHPVEYGSPISDHSYLEQPEVVMRLGYSDSAALPGYSAQNYQHILNVLAARQLMTITTGKTQWANMALEDVTQETDQATNGALLVTLRFRQKFVVYTQSAALPASAQAAPQQTGGTQAQGTQQPTAPAQPQSVLKRLGNALHI